MGFPSLIDWSFVFIILFRNCQLRKIMKAGWFNMPYIDSIFPPLYHFFSILSVVSLDQSLYLFSVSLTVIIMVHRSHTRMNLIYACYTSIHILLNTRNSGLWTGSFLWVGRAIIWRLKGTQDAIVSGIWYPHFSSLDTNSEIFYLVIWAGLWLPSPIASVKSFILPYSGKFSSGHQILSVR